MMSFFSNFFGKGGKTMATCSEDAVTKDYKLVQDSYTGHGGFANGQYLIKYVREEENDFANRRKQAYYLNLVGPIVDSTVKPVFSQEISRDYDSALYDVFVEDADGKGAGLTRFLQQALTVANVMGQSFVVMDSFPEEEIPPTLAEQLSARKVPFVTLKTPLDVKTYMADKFEKLISIDFYFGKDAEGRQLYRHFNNEVIMEYYEEESEKIVTRKVVHGLGAVPVIPSVYGDILPIPPILSLSQASKTLYNQLSELRELSRDSNFSLLVIPGADPKIAIEIGSKNSLFVPRDVTNMPTYISPNPAIPANVLEEIKFTVESILSQGELRGATVQTSNMSVKSGVALAFEFHGNVDALNTNADASELLEVRVARVFGLFTEPFEFSVQYARDYTPFSGDDILKQMAFLKDALALDLSPEINTKIKTLLLELIKYNSRISDAEYKELRETIRIELVEAEVVDTEEDTSSSV